MGGSESSKYTIGQRYKLALNLCISDIQAAINSMRDNGKLMKDINVLTIASGVMLTTILLAILTVKNLIPITLIADSATLDVSHVGVLQSSIAFHVLLMVNSPLTMKEELYVLQNAEMESCP